VLEITVRDELSDLNSNQANLGQSLEIFMAFEVFLDGWEAT
jgi:hypothetical protein